MIAKKLAKDETLEAETDRHWNEIVLRRYQFDRAEREVSVLKTLTPKMLLDFIDTYITMRPMEGESHRAKLAVIYSAKQHTLREPFTYESDESVAFANQPLPSEKSKAANESAVIGDVVTPPAAEEVNDTDATTPALAKEMIVLPQVPVDHRPIRMIDDIPLFKRKMPLWPSFQ